MSAKVSTSQSTRSGSFLEHAAIKATTAFRLFRSIITPGNDHRKDVESMTTVGGGGLGRVDRIESGFCKGADRALVRRWCRSAAAVLEDARNVDSLEPKEDERACGTRGGGRGNRGCNGGFAEAVDIGDCDISTLARRPRLSDRVDEASSSAAVPPGCGPVSIPPTPDPRKRPNRLPSLRRRRKVRLTRPSRLLGGACGPRWLSRSEEVVFLRSCLPEYNCGAVA